MRSEYPERPEKVLELLPLKRPDGAMVRRRKVIRNMISG
jgi:hypothetical protein